MRKLKNEELGRLSVEEFKSAQKLNIVIVLDNVRSLNNVGSIFRTADAFRLTAMFLCGCTGCPPNKEIHRSALGSTETVDWKYFKTTAEAIIELKKDGYKICAVEQAENSVSLPNFISNANEKIAIIFGHEVYGVEQEIINSSDCCIEIPQIGTKHSLNISVSVGVVVWEIARNIFPLK